MSALLKKKRAHLAGYYKDIQIREASVKRGRQRLMKRGNEMTEIFQKKGKFPGYVPVKIDHDLHNI